MAIQAAYFLKWRTGGGVGVPIGEVKLMEIVFELSYTDFEQESLNDALLVAVEKFDVLIVSILIRHGAAISDTLSSFRRMFSYFKNTLAGTYIMYRRDIVEQLLENEPTRQITLMCGASVAVTDKPLVMLLIRNGIDIHVNLMSIHTRACHEVGVGYARSLDRASRASNTLFFTMRKRVDLYS